MFIRITNDSQEAGIEAGKKAASLIRWAIASKGNATIILATGSSQFETLNQLAKEEGIEWNKVMMFHLDEYIDLPVSHKASFRKYLQERFIEKVPTLNNVNLINGETDPEQECRRLEGLVLKSPVDVALVGIGENGHLAFNDPPADFETERAYLVVKLDEQCRQQQVNEGWQTYRVHCSGNQKSKGSKKYVGNAGKQLLPGKYFTKSSRLLFIS
jgi:glucosamine-6-phosphate deaminase